MADNESSSIVAIIAIVIIVVFLGAVLFYMTNGFKNSPGAGGGNVTVAPKVTNVVPSAPSTK